MKRPSLLLASALLLSVFTSSCKLLTDFLRSTFREPTFTFKAVVLTDLSLTGLTLDTVWDLTNPNTVGVSLASVDYALFIDGHQVVAGSPPRGLTIPANGSTELHFPAAVKFADLAAVVETFLSKDTATWRAEGKLGVETPVGVLTLPLAKEGTFDVPKLPAFALSDPRVTNVSLAGATIELPMTLTNRNAFPLPVAGVDGSLTIAGSTVGRVSTGNLGVLDPHGTKRVTVPVQLSFLSAASAVASALQGGTANVVLDLRVQSGALSLPVRVEQVVRFNR